VLLDPNCRTRAITDTARYHKTVAALLLRTDVAKVSVDDLRLLAPGTDARAAARGLLELGPAAVLVTDGPTPVWIHTAAGERSMAVPEVDVVDPIGAGDAFVAGFLTWWCVHGQRRADVADVNALGEATAAGITVAAAACSVRGGQPARGVRLVERPTASPASSPVASAAGHGRFRRERYAWSRRSREPDPQRGEASPVACA
jgi:fructokinase